MRWRINDYHLLSVPMWSALRLNTLFYSISHFTGDHCWALKFLINNFYSCLRQHFYKIKECRPDLMELCNKHNVYRFIRTISLKLCPRSPNAIIKWQRPNEVFAIIVVSILVIAIPNLYRSIMYSIQCTLSTQVSEDCELKNIACPIQQSSFFYHSLSLFLFLSSLLFFSFYLSSSLFLMWNCERRCTNLDVCTVQFLFYTVVMSSNLNEKKNNKNNRIQCTLYSLNISIDINMNFIAVVFLVYVYNAFYKLLFRCCIQFFPKLLVQKFSKTVAKLQVI